METNREIEAQRERMQEEKWCAMDDTQQQQQHQHTIAEHKLARG